MIARLGYATVMLTVCFGTACSTDDSAPPIAGPVFSSDEAFPNGTAPASEAPAPGSAIFDGKLATNPARVITTGTLAVTADGAFAVAADSERDVLVVVALDGRTATRVALTAGDEPGLTIAGKVNSDGAHSYTVLRGASAFVDLNASTAKVTRVPTCFAPRGVAYDAAANLVHVACATGELVSYDADTWAPQRHLVLQRDLRDVVVTDEGLVVSRFSSAELSLVDASGETTPLGAPQLPPECASPTVMHRIVVRGNELHAAHQQAANTLVLGRGSENADTCAVAQSATVYWRAALDEVTALASKGPAAAREYFGGFKLARDGVEPIGGSRTIAFEGDFFARLGNGVGPLDLAVDATGRVAVSAAGNYWQEELPTIVTWDYDDAARVRQSAFRVGGAVTSVAFDGDGSWLALSREPAALYFEDGGVVFFGGRSVNNTAHAIFHMNTGTGVACSSCHPEGGQDEHVWTLRSGPRRTLPLGPALQLGRGYNWDQSETIEELLTHVLNHQMAYEHVALPHQSQALEAWLHELPAPSPGVIVNIGATKRGRAVFAASGCESCHVASNYYTDGALHDVGTAGEFETPSLIGVGGRSRLLHDGCATTLLDVFGACGGDETHRVTSRVSPQDVDDLLVFLSTL